MYFSGASKGPKHKCFFMHYCCPHPSHGNGEKVHVLLCSKHKNGDENLKLLEKFEDKFIINCNVQLPQFSKNISCLSEMAGVAKVVNKSLNMYGNYQSEPDITECAIFLLQTIDVDGIRLNLFFDSGCGDMVVKKLH